MRSARRRQQRERVWAFGRLTAKAALAGALIVGAVAQATRAQPAVGGALPCEIAATERVDTAAEAKIREYVSRHAQALKSQNASEGSRSRDALIEPLACAQVSVSFRLKYAEIVEPTLTPLVTAGDDRVAVNAMRVAARLRTTASLRPIEAGLASASVTVRYGAASASRELLSILATDSFGFPENNVERLMDRLATALKSEADPIVADGLTLALCEGPKASASMRAKAAARLNAAFAQRVRTLREQNDGGTMWNDVMFRALDASRLAILEQIAAGGADKETAVTVALMGGQALATARDRLGSSSAAERESLARLVNGAEIAMVIAHNAVTGQKVGEKALQRAFASAATSGNAQEFAAAIDSWIGPSGLLTKPPYAAKTADFAGK